MALRTGVSEDQSSCNIRINLPVNINSEEIMAEMLYPATVAWLLGGGAGVAGPQRGFLRGAEKSIGCQNQQQLNLKLI